MSGPGGSFAGIGGGSGVSASASRQYGVALSWVDAATITVGIGQRLADRRDQVVVNFDRHVVGKQRRSQTAFVVPRLGVVDVTLDTASECRGERVFMIGELFVILIEGVPTYFTFRTDQQLAKGCV